MYWQVYLHKTSLVAELLLIRLFKRAKQLIHQNTPIWLPESLHYFLKEPTPKDSFSNEHLNAFSTLDDYDVFAVIKAWAANPDFILSELASMLLNRNLLKIKIKQEPFEIKKIETKKNEVQLKHNLSEDEASYFVFKGEISNQAYRMDQDNINLLTKSGKLVDVAKAC